jgi:hypothetical protein
MSKPKIRFVDSMNNTLFYIDDGEDIELEVGDEWIQYTCHYIDDFHFKLGSYIYHIGQFAQEKEKLVQRYRPFSSETYNPNGEKQVSSKMQEISAIENKYGLVLFRMGLTHLVDVGIRHLTSENVNENIRQIEAKGDADHANGVVTVMTAEFQCEILRCAAELAKFSVWELFDYIKKHVAISNHGGNYEQSYN